MKSTIKFALLCGALTMLAAILCTLSFSIRGLSRLGTVAILISGLAFAVPVFFGPYLASRKGWLSFPVSLRRLLLAVIPLPFLPVAFCVGMIGWGDMQEHLIRGMLHASHRELSNPAVGTLIVTGIAISGGIATGCLIWVSVSALTRRWSAQTLLTFCTSCAILMGLFWAAPFATDGGTTIVTAVGLLLIFVSGFLFAFAIEMNATPGRTSLAFRFASAIALIFFLATGPILFANSVPEKHFPKIAVSPLWTFDLASTGCRPQWGGPNSSDAANEIAFATDQTLGMTFETSATPLENNEWKFTSCIFTIDVKSGQLIAHISVDSQQRIVSGNTNGNFRVSTGDISTTYSPDLQQLGPPEAEKQPAEHWTAASWHNFRSDSDGKLWFVRDGETKLLAQYQPREAFIHPLGPEHVLVTAGGQFSLFRADGTQVSTESFTRERVNFAALSADHRRFAVAVYLWGVGDPSYLEEEKIVVYDTETGKAVAALSSDPLPTNQSWAALSPDGTLLAVGAQATLRLFRLPPPAQN